MSISKTLTDLCEIRPEKNKKEKSTFPNVVYNTLVVKNVIEIGGIGGWWLIHIRVWGGGPGLGIIS